MLIKVLSIEQMLHLKELGVDTSDAREVNVFPYEDFLSYNSYTLDDIIEKLPTAIRWRQLIIVGSKIMYSEAFGEGYDNPLIEFQEDTLIDSAYEMLCWCAEKGYLNEK